METPRGRRPGQQCEQLKSATKCRDYGLDILNLLLYRCKIENVNQISIKWYFFIRRFKIEFCVFSENSRIERLSLKYVKSTVPVWYEQGEITKKNNKNKWMGR